MARFLIRKEALEERLDTGEGMDAAGSTPRGRLNAIGVALSAHRGMAAHAADDLP